jgi:hypothetical protein
MPGDVAADNGVWIYRDEDVASLSVGGIIESRSGGVVFPDGTVQTSAYPGDAGFISSSDCPSSTIQLHPGVCMDDEWQPATTAMHANFFCMDRGAHLCTHGELYSACVQGADGMSGGKHFDKKWFGNWAGVDHVVCGNDSNDNDCTDFDGQCEKNNKLKYRCCYSIHTGGL